MISVLCYIGDLIVLNQRNSISVDFKLNSVSDVEEPSFGIISNSGTVSFNDYDGKVLGYAEQGELVDGLQISIYMQNTLVSGKRELIARYTTTDWDYDNDSKQVSCTIKDVLEELQKIQFAGLNYIWQPETFADAYKRLYALTPSKFGFVVYDDLDDRTKSKLSSSQSDYFYIESGSLWNAWDKFANALFCSIYNDGQKTILNFVG